MGLIKTKKNKKFNYAPRYYKGEGNPFAIKHKFDEDRSTTKKASGIKAKFIAAFNELRNPQESSVKKRLFIIVLVLILIVLYILDFDLSIFFQQNNQ